MSNPPLMAVMLVINQRQQPGQHGGGVGGPLGPNQPQQQHPGCCSLQDVMFHNTMFQNMMFQDMMFENMMFQQRHQQLQQQFQQQQQQFQQQQQQQQFQQQQQQLDQQIQQLTLKMIRRGLVLLSDLQSPTPRHDLSLPRIITRHRRRITARRRIPLGAGARRAYPRSPTRRAR